MRKHIVVLANSVKHDPGRCIAGREISSVNDGSVMGPWIRPVRTLGEGELYPKNFTLEDGSVPLPFDVIEIYVDAPGTDVTQPENWFILDDGSRWKRVHDAGIEKAFGSFIENPPNLWLQQGVKTDRVTKEFLAANPPQQSLYLLDLRNAMIDFDGKKYRIRFSHNGIIYNLAVTDPLITNVVGNQQNLVMPKSLACISLAPAFFNQYVGIEFHYKLAAMVIPYG